MYIYINNGENWTDKFIYVHLVFTGLMADFLDRINPLRRRKLCWLWPSSNRSFELFLVLKFAEWSWCPCGTPPKGRSWVNRAELAQKVSFQALAPLVSEQETMTDLGPPKRSQCGADHLKPQSLKLAIKVLPQHGFLQSKKWQVFCLAMSSSPMIVVCFIPMSIDSALLTKLTFFLKAHAFIVLASFDTTWPVFDC